MLPMDKRYTVLVGNYGSGKTELAVAIARTQRAREPEGRIALVDLDIVNPYFRSAEQHALLEAEGHTVVSRGRTRLRWFVRDYERSLFPLSE